MTNSEGWQRVAREGEIEEGQPFAARLGDKDIVLVRHAGEIFALDGICPHAYALMADGFMNGAEIECPLHAACFNIRTGKFLDGPAGTGDLATYAVRIADGEVMVKAAA